MPHTPTATRLLVAWVDETGELDHVRRAALTLAKRDRARVILYDRDAASTFSDPMPNQWAAQGARGQLGDPLTDEELAKQGFEPFARMIAQARAVGVDAWGWLATEHGTGAAVDYARDHHADALLLPAELDDPSLGDRLKRETADRAVEEAEATHADLVVYLVQPDGTMQPRDGTG